MEGRDLTGSSTGRKQRDIAISSIYNSIRKLSTEEQALILGNYKIGDLYKLYNNEEEFNNYQKGLVDGSKLYMQAASVLAKHRTEALKEVGIKRESDMVKVMEEAYEGMTGWGQEKFCQEMVGNTGFFQNVYKAVMDVLRAGWKEQG